MRLAKAFFEFMAVLTISTLIGGGLLWILKPLIGDRFDSNLFSSALGIAAVFIFATYVIEITAYNVYFKGQTNKTLFRSGFCYVTSFILWLALQGALSTIDIQSSIIFMLSVSIGAAFIPIINNYLARHI